MTRQEDIWQCSICDQLKGRHDMWYENEVCGECFEDLTGSYENTEHFEKFMLNVTVRKITFFLFGKRAVDLLMSETKTPEYIVNELEGDYAVFSYTEGYNELSDLLTEYNGWNDFTKITPKQYYEFIKNKTK